MKKTIQLPEDLPREKLFADDFRDLSRQWEQTDIATEYAAITPAGYEMENRGDSQWTFYHLPMPLMKPDDFEVRARIRLLGYTQEGEFGITWGFRRPHDMLNRFALSTDGRRCTVCCFQKNHHRISHAFYALLPPPEADVWEFSIQKLSPYYLFRLNGRLLYIGHEAHFCWQGNRMGFYVEPGLKIVAKELVLERLV